MNPAKFLFLLSFTVLTSCAGLKFSQQSLDDTRRISDAAVALIQKGSDKYSAHATEIEKLRQDVMDIRQREAGRKMNEVSVAMWDEVIHAQGNLFDLFDKWKANETLSPAMRDQAGKQITRLLNSIYDLENHKRR